ncbi:uncharacterized protein [Linepithema humile]|uniref:uncharacterized protein isoform X1 n=1 Tax=Linepithema humile TaxID=83485 RepID=UPI00351F0024
MTTRIFSYNIGKYIVGASSKIYCNKFTRYRHFATAIEAPIDSQNIVSSGLSDVTGFENVYLHDFIWEKIGRWWNHTALVCSETGRSYTYAELRKACGRLATSLRKSNLLPGDHIAIILPNIPEFIIILLAANEAGLRTTLINPTYTEHEITKLLDTADAQAVFTFPAKCTVVEKSIAKNSKIKLPIVIVNDGTAASISGTIKLDDLMHDNIEEFSISQKTGVSYNDTVILPCSSGTTGLPKVVEITHRNIVANITQGAHPIFFPGEETTEHHQDIIPVILPLFHVAGLIISTYTYLRIGAKLVLMPHFTSEKFIKLLENHRFTVIYTVPPIVQMMANNERFTPRHISSVRMLGVGAAPIGEESIAQFRSRISDTIPIVQLYGATELSPLCTHGTANVTSLSCGHLLPNTQLKIVGTEDTNLNKNLGPKEIGEICIRGPQVMKGYYNNPKATTETMDGDWYKSGDLGYFTENGLLYVTGRLKEMIKVKGFQVIPTELEEVIRGCDKILDVAVIGVPHDKYGEIPKAFVVPKPGQKVNEDEIKKFVAERVSKIKHLGYVQILESIPKNPSGKILRKELKKL